MPGGHITDRQVRRFMDERKEGSSQAIASARAGFSESTARRVEKGRRILASQRLPRQYRTRVDPFQDVWRAEALNAEIAQWLERNSVAVAVNECGQPQHAGEPLAAA